GWSKRPAQAGRAEPAGQPVAAQRPDRGGVGGGAHEGHLPGGAVPAHRRAARQAAGHRGRRPQHPGERVPHVGGGAGLCGSGRELLRRAGAGAGTATTGAAAGAPRAEGHRCAGPGADTGGL
ncbi:MAG: hypothetical protein AVDCRST_MAG88-1536, partial [uncultured Thermomicrobiales bacterium]